MRAQLSFNLDDISDRLAHRRALNGTSAYVALFTIFNDVFRKRLKHGNLDFDSENLVTEIQQEMVEILEHYQIDLNDLE
jgi:hypothetical protein